eukprot:2795910-Amphidinium_carterae.1
MDKLRRALHTTAVAVEQHFHRLRVITCNLQAIAGSRWKSEGIDVHTLAGVVVLDDPNLIILSAIPRGMRGMDLVRSA